MTAKKITVTNHHDRDYVHDLPHGGTYNVYDGCLTIHQYTPRKTREWGKDRTIYDCEKLCSYASGKWQRVIVS